MLKIRGENPSRTACQLPTSEYAGIESLPRLPIDILSANSWSFGRRHLRYESVRAVPKIGKIWRIYSGNEQDILKDHFNPPAPSSICQKCCFIIRIHLSVLLSCIPKRAPSLSLQSISWIETAERPRISIILCILFPGWALIAALETVFIWSQPDGRNKEFQLISFGNFLLSSRPLGTSRVFPLLLTHAGSRSSKLREKIMEQLKSLSNNDILDVSNHNARDLTNHGGNLFAVLCSFIDYP
jgi:hypothetical protein